MSKKPNLVYIFADDLGYGDVAALNERCAFPTPGFDALCENGCAFTDAHASSAVCTPSRYSVLTGRYNWRSPLKSDVLAGYSPALIEEGRLTVAEFLRQQGYATAAIGKWHLGMDFGGDFFGGDFVQPTNFDAVDGVDYAAPIKNAPVHRGFDYYYGISGSLDMPPYVYIENDRFTALPTRTTSGTGMGYWRAGPTAEDFKHEEVLPELTGRALGYIEAQARKAQPFFLYFPLPAPHAPILPSAKFAGKSGTNAYGDFVMMVDDVVAQVDAKLRECGIREDTILIFTSDNGCSPVVGFEELARFGHNPSYVFRGHKADIYEGGHRIPLLVQWPGGMPAGGRCGQTVCLTDLMATMAEIVGALLPENAGEDSVSNLPLWQNPAAGPVREYTVHQSIDGSLALRRGRWKLEMCPGSGGWSPPAPGKEAPDAPRFQLYDLAADIGERTNVIAENPQVAAEMRAVLKDIVRRGRSTPGAPQPNSGAPVWAAAAWLEEPAGEADG